MGTVSAKALGSNLLLLMMFLAFSQGEAAAVDDATSALLGEIRQATASVRAFRSQFVQERRLSLFAEPVIFHGSLTVVRPDQLRWEFTRPVPSALIFNGRSGLRCNDQAEPSRFDLDTDPIMRTVAEQLWVWLGGDYSKLGDGYQLHSENDSLIIRPKDEKTREYVEKITITFNRQTLQPEEVAIDEPGGDATLLRFTATDQERGDRPPPLHALFPAMKRSEIVLRWVLALLVVGLGLLAIGDLRLKEDAVDLLPGEAVRGDIRQLQRLGLVDRVFITLTAAETIGDSAERRHKLQNSAATLGAVMAESGHFSYVLARLPAGYENALFASMQRSLPALLDHEGRSRLREMTTPAGIAAGLTQAFSLLNGPGSMAMKRQVQHDPLGFSSLILSKLNHLRADFAVRLEDGFFISRDGRSCLVAAESRQSLTNLNNALELQSFFQNAQSRLAPGIEMRLIGSLPHTLANSATIKHDLRVLLPIASVLLLALLLFSLRSPRALAVFIVPFLAAPPAIALTSMVHGELTGLALGFGIVLLGIAVDFSVHLYLALCEGQGDRQQIYKQVAKPMAFATITTLAVFVVLLFSEVASHRHMALLAMSGVIIALGLTWLLIPTVQWPVALLSAIKAGR
jgi:hypothetical protein